MRILSVNVGQPKKVMWQGEPLSTGIFKEPVTGSITLRTENFEGDAQADLSVHGGPNRAVLAYPSEHFDFWRQTYPAIDFSAGVFGENLTTEGMLETELNVGDVFRVGTAEIAVTQPRVPCYKLWVKLGESNIVKKYLDSRRTGFLFKVIKEGQVAAGDEI